jgi:hypothetical protein
MTVTYDNTDLNSTTASGKLNVVRLLLGDTNYLDAELQDEEINYYISVSTGNLYLAASNAANAIGSKYAGLVNVEIDGVLKEDYSDLYDRYRNLGIQLRSDGQKLVGASMGISVGGLSTTATGKNNAFSRGQFENPPGTFTSTDGFEIDV